MRTLVDGGQRTAPVTKHGSNPRPQGMWTRLLEVLGAVVAEFGCVCNAPIP